MKRRNYRTIFLPHLSTQHFVLLYILPLHSLPGKWQISPVKVVELYHGSNLYRFWFSEELFGIIQQSQEITSVLSSSSTVMYLCFDAFFIDAFSVIVFVYIRKRSVCRKASVFAVHNDAIRPRFLNIWK